jgi:hypothetical protein
MYQITCYNAVLQLHTYRVHRQVQDMPFIWDVSLPASLRKCSQAQMGASARAGCNVSTEPNYTSVGVAAVSCQGKRAYIEASLSQPHSPTLVDVS